MYEVNYIAQSYFL